MPDDVPVNPATDSTWREIEQLVDEVSVLARSESTYGGFYAGLLDRAVRALAARGGAVWTRDTTGELQPAFQLHYQDTIGPKNEQNAAHRQLVDAVTRAGRSRVFAPGWESADEGANPTDQTLILCPVVVDRQVAAVVEIVQRPGAAPAVEEGYRRLVAALCDLASQFHRHLQLTDLREKESVWAQVAQLVERAHASLDVDPCAYAIANEGRQFVGCDRLSVLTCRGRKARVRAVSGVDTVDRRSNLVRSMELLATAVVATREPLWSDVSSDDLPPALPAVLQAFLDESHARTVAVVPLSASEHGAREESVVFGAVVAERFTAEADARVDRRRVQTVCRHAASALANALLHRSLPMFPLLRFAAGVRRAIRAPWLPRALVAFLVLALTIAALCLIPAEFRIEARGELQPEIRRVVFAPADGVVQRVCVEHADAVSAGQVLLELQRSELDFEFARVLGEQQTAQQQLDSVQASRLQAERSSDDEREEFEQLTAREEELKKQLESLAAQRSILVAQKAELTVTSPIAGQLLTWDVARTLEARPVVRGQALMTVVDPEGRWILELQVADQRVGHVINASRQLDSQLPVSFILATEPGRTYAGGVERVALATETNVEGQSAALVTVNIDRDTIAQLRPGASVVAKIYCGRRALGYVWFHELLEAVQRHLLF